VSNTLDAKIADIFNEPGCEKNQAKGEKERKKGCSKPLTPGAAAGGCAFDGAKIALGYDLSFSGISTFKTAEDLRTAAAECPADRIHVETDAPFLAPIPMRGRKNQPANVAFTCAALSAASRAATSWVWRW